MLADSHAHLHLYADPDPLIARARSAGIETIVAVAIDLPSSIRNVELARIYPEIVAAVGFHPSHLIAPLTEHDLAALRRLLADPLVGFVGEIGLDAIEYQAPLQIQEAAFQAQLGLAKSAGLTVNLHVRGPFDRAFDLLRDMGMAERAILHYFVGDWSLASRALDLGLSLSVGKPATRPENHALRDAIRWTPLDRLLLETDSYPLSGRTTEPRDVGLVAQAVADLKGLSVARVEVATTANLTRLGRIPPD